MTERLFLKNTVDDFLINPISCATFDQQLPQFIHKRLMHNIELENPPGEYPFLLMCCHTNYNFLFFVYIVRWMYMLLIPFQNPKFDEVPGLMANFMTNLNLRLSMSFNPLSLPFLFPSSLILIFNF